MRPDPLWCSTLAHQRSAPDIWDEHHQSWALCTFLCNSAPGLRLKDLSSKDSLTGFAGAPWRVLPGPGEVNRLPCPEGSLQANSNLRQRDRKQVAQDMWLGGLAPGWGTQPHCPARDSVGTGVTCSQHSQRAGGDGSTAAMEVLLEPLSPPQPTGCVTRMLHGSACMAQRL